MLVNVQTFVDSVFCQYFESKKVVKDGYLNIGVARGGKRGHGLPKILGNIVILCFERRFFSTK